MPRLTLRKVNAFTTGGVAATGNPAAVCLLDAALLGSMPDSLRQSIAADIGLSETAYVEPLDAASSPGPDVFKQLDTFRLRWFTPAAEVPLCGHATLASAATLFTECGNPAPTLHFHTLSGILSVTRQQHGQQQLLRMSLPLSTATDPLPPQLQPPASCSPAAAAAAAAGNADPADPSGDNAAAFSQLFAESPRLTELLYTALSALPSSAAAVPAAPDGAAAAADKAAWLSHVVQHVGYVAPLKYMLVALQPALQLGRQGLEALALDAVALEAAGSADYMGGLIVSTLPSTGEAGGYDFHSRFFGPWLGVPEDPVTGSAHAVLAPYYAAVLRKQQLFARQCSARGGDVWMDAAAQPGRVLVSGEAAMEQTWEAEY
uniref:Phenazine biosynthesis-like domain-containing protein n=1 Tax=Tetradesmus obliquus TaxID=3088 RepID=A0A383VVK7_TETOB|eukprot:jgi/Sobl393_1/9989/SZX68456.1